MNTLLRGPVTLCLLALVAGVGCSTSSSAPACGGQGQACCNLVTCSGDLVCLSDVCAVPGGSTVNTSSGGTTGSPTSGATGAATSGNANGTTGSASGTAGATTGGPVCGGVSQTCCAGQSCNGSLVCQGGTCAQPQSGVAGTPCLKNSDCPTGICLPAGQPAGGQAPGESAWTGNVCTTTCSSTASCVAGWTCAALAGQSSDVCQCHYAQEVCDGLDNDCDGIVDDEPGVDNACVASLASGATCKSGTCECPAGQVACHGQCVSLGTTANCSACGDGCATGASCNGGSCSCPSGQTVCSGACVDTQSSLQDCGGCDKPCTAIGQACSSGQCTCPQSQTVCQVCNDGGADCVATCVDTQTDTSNCGTCGHVCPTMGMICATGTCQCAQSQEVCSIPCPEYDAACGSECCATTSCATAQDTGISFCGGFPPGATCAQNSDCASQGCCGCGAPDCSTSGGCSCL